jgi:hypothetical protein
MEKTDPSNFNVIEVEANPEVMSYGSSRVGTLSTISVAKMKRGF